MRVQQKIQTRQCFRHIYSQAKKFRKIEIYPSEIPYLYFLKNSYKLPINTEVEPRCWFGYATLPCVEFLHKHKVNGFFVKVGGGEFDFYFISKRVFLFCLVSDETIMLFIQSIKIVFHIIQAYHTFRFSFII
jgi:hypothetical protein